MDRESIKIKFLDIAAGVFKKNIHDITLNDSRETMDTWDSLTHLIFFIEIQKEFAITFNTEEIAKLVDLMSIYNAIINKSI